MKKNLTEVELSPAVKFTHDWIFKHIFADKRNDYRLLRHLVHSIIGGEEIKSLVIENSEEDKEKEEEKNIRFDIKATLDRGDQVNIEMQLNPPTNEELFERAAHYLVRMAGSQKSKSLEYKELVPSYCIFLCDFEVYKKKGKWLSWHQMYDKFDKESLLTEKLNVIIIELKKGQLFEQKEISEMSDLEKWVTVISTRNLRKIEEIVQTEEIMQEAVEKLIEINENDVERAYAESRYKKQMDEVAYSLTYRRLGKEEGIQQGIEQKAYDVAMSMLKENFDDEMILKISGITSEQLNELKLKK